MRRSLLQILLPALAGAILIAAWYAIYWSLSEDSRFLLPPPQRVLAALHENGAVLWRSTINTGTAAIVGFGIATLLGFLLAIMLAVSPLVRAGFYPYLMALQMTPMIVVAPMLVVWVGPGFKSVVILTTLVCFFPIVVNTTQGLVATDRDLVELFQMWRTNRWQQLIHLRVPAALPFFFTGWRIAAVLAPIAALVADYTAGSSLGEGGGLGFQAIIYSAQAQYPALFATAIVTCVLGFIFTGGVIALSWLALHQWYDAYERSDR